MILLVETILAIDLLGYNVKFFFIWFVPSILFLFEKFAWLDLAHNEKLFFLSLAFDLRWEDHLSYISSNSCTWIALFSFLYSYTICLDEDAWIHVHIKTNTVAANWVARPQDCLSVLDQDRKPRAAALIHHGEQESPSLSFSWVKNICLTFSPMFLFYYFIR